MEYKINPTRILAEIVATGHEIVHVASLTDTEGWVGLKSRGSHPLACLSISNNNRHLLERIQGTIGGHISPNSEGFQLQLRGKKSIEVVRILPLMHEEKVTAKELLIRHYDNGGIGLDALREYQEFRRRIENEVRLCEMQARLEYIREHGRPHTNDPDQSMP